MHGADRILIAVCFCGRAVVDRCGACGYVTPRHRAGARRANWPPEAEEVESAGLDDMLRASVERTNHGT